MINFLVTVAFTLDLFKSCLAYNEFFVSFNKKITFQFLALFSLTHFFFLKKKLFLVFSLFCLPYRNFFNFQILNDLMKNNLFFFHPYFVALVLTALFFLFFSIKVKLLSPLLLLMILGMLWSAQEVFWGGVWDWNTLELSNLIIASFLIIQTHFRVNSVSKSSLIFCTLVTIFFLNNFLNLKSVHSFSFLPINNLSSVFFLFSPIFFFIKKNQIAGIFLYSLFLYFFNVKYLENVFFFNKTLFLSVFWFTNIIFLSRGFFFFLTNPFFLIFSSSFIYFFKNTQHFLIKIKVLCILFVNYKTQLSFSVKNYVFLKLFYNHCFLNFAVVKSNLCFVKRSFFLIKICL